MKKDKKKILKWKKSQEIYGTKLEFPVVKNRSLRRKKEKREYLKKQKQKNRYWKGINLQRRERRKLIPRDIIERLQNVKYKEKMLIFPGCNKQANKGNKMK